MKTEQGTSASFDRQRFLSGIGFGLLGAVLFSGKAILVKLGFRYGADPITLIALRMAFAAPLFLLVIWVLRLRQSQPLSRRDWAGVVVMGLVGYYLSSFLDFLALQHISAGLARVIQHLTPTLVTLIAVLFLRRKIGRREIAALIIAYVGVLFVFWHDLRTTQGQVLLGAAIEGLSALSYAIYLTMAGAMVQRVGPLRLVALASLVATVACVGQALVIDAAALINQPAEVYVLSMVNAAVCTVAPILLVGMAIDRLGPPVASQTNMPAPIMTILMAALVLGEPVGALQFVGIGILLLGVYILSTKKS